MHTNFLFLLSCFLLFTTTSFAGEPRELEWDELMPPGYVESIYNSTINDFSATDSIDFDDSSDEGMAAFEELKSQLSSAPIVPELNNQSVKIAGFIVPLDFDFEDETFTNFLLVPYFGACIHVPPPPSNQVIHIQSAKPLDQELLDYAVWVTGKLTTESVYSEEAYAGYSIKNAQLDIYEEE